ncbi:MAG: sigma 54-interacting transcriptional regulator [Solobacterium sp.]|jgi:sigma-54 dependent transcriptional regulator of gfr operon|nr:sigma 54-interacting transcriptional regulator [Solobacterium sp.]
MAKDKKDLLNKLGEYTKLYGLTHKECFTALFLGNELDLSRNAVSQYLNEYVQQGKAVKINTRPVYFYHAEVLEELGYEILGSTYSSFESLKKQDSDFDTLIGANGSLFHVIEQCKAAVSYPPLGLPVLLHGQTGTGKSMIARTMYDYGTHKGIIAPDNKFLVLNCSEYANNPELLSANLFGSRKGAYTGADTDNPGLLQLADGGILFLDEVHCLKAECQEKLFLFMDQGTYHRVGDNEHWYHSSCRLVFATTEQPEEVLLKTLLRRIPIAIEVPSVEERGRDEKQALISFIFKKESREIDRDIEISYLAYQVLMDAKIAGNIGGLFNCVKAACAKAFLHDHGQNEALHIHVYDLPDYVLQLAPNINFKLQDSTDIRMMRITFPVVSNTYHSQLLRMYKKMLEQYQAWHDNPLNVPLASDELRAEIINYDDYVMYDRGMMDNLNSEFTNKITDKILSIMMNKYSLKISNNDILLISRYLSEYAASSYEVNNWLVENAEEVKGLCEIMQMKFPREYAISEELCESINLNLDIRLDDMMMIRLLMMITDFHEEKSQSNTVAVILCHGYSTASSIADAANKMIGTKVFDAIDMQLDMSTDKIIVQLNSFLKMKSQFDSLLLLVDMGSLEEIHKGLKIARNVNIGVINNVSTRMALTIGASIRNGTSMEETLEKACAETGHAQFRFIDNSARKRAILSVCATGIGTAKKIMSLFEKSLPCPIDADIVSYDYQKLADAGKKDSIFEKYNVAFIIGTMNPFVEGVKFVAIEDLVLSSGIDELRTLMKEFLNEQQISVFRDNIIKNFTLNNIVNHLTILNAEKVLEDVDEVVKEIEETLQIELPAARKIGLYVHLSCLIERLILHDEIQLEENPDEFIESHQEFVTAVRQAFSGVQELYSVAIPDSEIVYIFNYIEEDD